MSGHDSEGQGADPLAPPAGLTGGGLVEFSTRRRVTVAMFWITMFLFGFLGLMALKVNLLPDLSYPTPVSYTHLDVYKRQA